MADIPPKKQSRIVTLTQHYARLYPNSHWKFQKVYTEDEFGFTEGFVACWSLHRVGLKPMQPMQLHWAPRIWGPRAMVF